MEVSDRDLPLLFYIYLCKAVGSEDVVKTRRRIFNAIDFVGSSENVTYISSGSKAEGLDLEGSDLDVMIVDKNIVVYENDLNEHNKRILPIIMDTENTKAGFTRLKLDGNYLEMSYLKNCCKDGDKQYSYISSKLFRERDLPKFPDSIIHGPCLSDKDGRVDIAESFRCKQWIKPAQQWINRSRYSWPKNNLVDSIVDYGVLFVPIGCKDSPHEDLEFRISFSVAEKILIHSFNHVQLLCYALLKITLKELIKPHHKDLLCSYFLKTIMFWMLEETQMSDWKPRNILRCFEQCIKRLVYSVTYETCLNYFIPENNLFENRFDRSEHEALLDTLHCLYSLGWKCVLQTKTLQSFIYMMQPFPTTVISSVCALPCVCYLNCNSISVQFESGNVPAVKGIFKAVFASQHSAGKEIYALLLAQSSRIAAQKINVHSSYGNKDRYASYKQCISHLQMGLHDNALSGWLYLASFFYAQKQYRQCLHLLDYSLDKCTPDKILLTDPMDIELQHEFNKYMKKTSMRNQFLNAYRNRVVDLITFKDKNLLPLELHEMVHEYFPPVIFAHLLKFLSLHRLNETAEKRNSLRDLKSTFREMYFIIQNEKQIATAYKCLFIAERLLHE